MTIDKVLIFFLIFLTAAILLTGCTSSEKDGSDTDTVSVVKTEPKEEEENGDLIIKTALEEQKNEMYKVDADSTTIYWLDNKTVHFSKTTKCNIFALNTIYKAGFLTPGVYLLSRNLYNDSLFNDILPVIEIKDPEDLRKGDLIVWRNHIIIFEKIVYQKNTVSAYAIYAGTSQKDNGANILNNVIYGKYPLKGKYFVRRPIKRNN